MRTRGLGVAALSLLCLLGASGREAHAAPVLFDMASASTDSEQLDFHVQDAVDGDLANVYGGWSPIEPTTSSTAVWETTTDVTGATLLTFTLSQNFAQVPTHLLGRFRLSVTGDDRSTFANGTTDGSGITAAFTVLSGAMAVSLPSGMSYTELGDGSLLVALTTPGAVPGTGTYVVTYSSPLALITGVRLEAIDDPSLPGGGPGFESSVGDFVLSEIQLDADTVSVPEPASTALLALATAPLALRRIRRRTA